VITYAAINLTNKKLYVGSTVDFEARCEKHHRNKGDLAFHRSLRKDPANFYWIVGDDDGLTDRSEEQYYLDFYHGTAWCYNLRPSAESGGDTCSNTSWWNNGTKNCRSVERPGDEWVPGKLGKTAGYWWNNGTITVRSHECPGEGWVRGTLHRRETYPVGEDHPTFGRKYGPTFVWNNGARETRSLDCPGEGWVKGALPGTRTGPKKSLRGKDNPSAKRIVLILPNGEEKYYDSVVEACEEYGLRQEHLGAVARGTRKHHKGFKARYI
jgi:hypothetical protein